MEPSVIARLDKIADRMESLLLKYSNVQSGEAAPVETAPPPTKAPCLQKFDLDMKDKLTEYVIQSSLKGGQFARLAEPMFDMFMEQRYFLEMATQRTKPTTEQEFRELMKGMITAQSQLHLLIAKYDAKDDYVSAVNAAATFINWNNPFCFPGPPAEFLQAVLDEMMFYLNRVLVKSKINEKAVYEIAMSLKELFYTFRKHVATHHPKGFTWNSHPRPVAPTAAAPPPPPPPPAAPVCQVAPAKTVNAVTALMADLNTGLSATSRLKKASREKRESIWKWKAPQKLPENLEKRNIYWNGQRWMVENLKEDDDAEVYAVDMKMPVYMFNCQQSKILVKKKANSIIIDNCKDLVVTCDGLVATCEVINSSNIEIRSRGRLPTLSIQGTRGCHVFLPEEHPDTQIVSSASTSMLVTVDRKNGTPLELPIPEQFVTCIEGDKLVTKPTEIV